MASPIVGEIRISSYFLTPRNWVSCTGQQLMISQFGALYGVIGDIYHKDPEFGTFYLPNLSGTVLMGQGTSSVSGTLYEVGQTVGASKIPATEKNMPPHSHTLYGDRGVSDNNAPYNKAVPGVRVIDGSGEAVYRTNTGDNHVGMGAGTIGTTGGGEGHENRQPFLALTYLMCLDGVFPPRS